MATKQTELAHEFMKALNAGDTAKLETLFADDGVFNFPRLDPIKGGKGVREFFDMAKAKFFKKMTLTPTAVYQDGDAVVMPWSNESPTHFGWTYVNRGLFVFKFRGDKIVLLDEYLDTLNVAPLMEQAGMGKF